MSLFFGSNDEDLCEFWEWRFKQDLIIDRVLRRLARAAEFNNHIKVMKLSKKEWSEWTDHFFGNPPKIVYGPMGETEVIAK